MESITFEQLTPEHKAELQKAIDNNKKFRELKVLSTQLERAGKYIESMRMRKLAKDFKTQVINNYCAKLEQERVSLGSMLKQMTPQDVQQMDINVHTIAFICDIIEDCVMSSNYILHKYFPNYNIECFNKLTELEKECKSNLKEMYNVCDERSGNLFAETVDELKEMIDDKVKELVIKLKAKKNNE